MTINFYLNKRNNKRNLFSIQMYIRHAGTVTVFSVGEAISEKNWISTKQRAKIKYAGSAELNSYLDALQRTVTKAGRAYLSETDKFEYADFRTAITTAFNQKTGRTLRSEDFFTVLNSFIDEREKHVTTATKKQYIALRNLLLNFQLEVGHLKLSKVNLQFMQNFKDFLLSKDYQNSTAKKVLTQLKTFFNYCVEQGYIADTKFKQINQKAEKTEILYFTENEITAIENLELAGLLEQDRKIYEIIQSEL